MAASGCGAYVAALLLLLPAAHPSQLAGHFDLHSCEATASCSLSIGDASVTLSCPDLQVAAPGGGAHAAALLLQLLRGCEDEAERVAALQGLVASLVEGPRPTRAAFAALPGWEELLVELLLEGAPGVPPQASH